MVVAPYYNYPCILSTVCSLLFSIFPYILWAYALFFFFFLFPLQEDMARAKECGHQVFYCIFVVYICFHLSHVTAIV